MSHILVSVRQPTRIGHMWRIIIGHSTLATSYLLIYNKHRVHEYESPQPFKVIQRYYKICTTRKLPTWMGHFTSCHQDKPLLHMVPVSHTKCQPRDMEVSCMHNTWILLHGLPNIALGPSTTRQVLCKTKGCDNELNCHRLLDKLYDHGRDPSPNICHGPSTWSTFT